MIVLDKDLTYPIASRGAGTRHRAHGLPGHRPKGDGSQQVKPERAENQGTELDVREKAA